jgi:hypothetical protein
MNIQTVFTPRVDDPAILLVLKKINSKYQPEYIDVAPAVGAQINECVPAVFEKIGKDGGKILYGWQLCKERIIAEALFHTVWESPEKKVIDITPKTVSMKKILFVRDDRIEYNGCQIDNIRVNTTSSSLVDEFILMSEALFSLGNKGEKAKVQKIVLKDEPSLKERLSV